MVKVHARIQKWGNGLALRISGVMRELMHLQEGMMVDVEINKNEFTVKKTALSRKKKFPYTEKELLKELSPAKVHADLLALPLPHEVDR